MRSSHNYHRIERDATPEGISGLDEMRRGDVGCGVDLISEKMND